MSTISCPMVAAADASPFICSMRGRVAWSMVAVPLQSVCVSQSAKGNSFTIG